MKEELITRVKQDIEALANIGRNDDTGGFTRLAWSEEETGIHSYFSNCFIREEYDVWIDEVGNTHVRLNAEKPTESTVYVVSHGDSVREGGNYDGIVGLIAAKESLIALESEKERINNAEMVIFRGEESDRWKKAYLGSDASLGLLNPDILKRADDNRTTLEAAILEAGFSTRSIREQRPLIDIDSIEALFELHIEQSVVLEREGLDFGIITSVRGPYRMEVEIIGDYDHSGGTPMDLRRDSVRAFTHLSHRIEKIGQDYLKQGKDLVWTIPYLHTDTSNEALNKIPGYVKFAMDIRSFDKDARDSFVKEVRSNISIYANKNNAQPKIRHLSDSDPVKELDPGLQNLLEESAKENGQKYKRMPSGPGHDFAEFARVKKSDGSYVPVAGAFVPCRHGKSHSTMEFAEYNHIANGILNIIYAVKKKVLETD